MRAHPERLPRNTIGSFILALRTMKANMTMIAATLVLAVLAVMLCPSSVFSQNGMQLIWGGGYQFSKNLDGMPLPDILDPLCPIYHDGNVCGHQGWAELGLRSSGLFGNSIDVELWAGLAYSSVAARWIVQEVQVIYLISEDTAGSISSDIGFHHQLWTTALQLDLLARFNLVGGLHLESGMRLGHRLGSGLSRRIVIINAPGLTFPDGTSEIVPDKASLDTSPFSASLAAGLAYDIPLCDVLEIRPAAGLRLNLTENPLVSPSTLDLGIGILFSTPGTE